MVQPPISSEEQHDDRDADPCPPEDEECFDAPDAAKLADSLFHARPTKPDSK